MIDQVRLDRRIEIRLGHRAIPAFADSTVSRSSSLLYSSRFGRQRGRTIVKNKTKKAKSLTLPPKLFGQKITPPRAIPNLVLLQNRVAYSPVYKLAPAFQCFGQK